MKKILYLSIILLTLSPINANNLLVHTNVSNAVENSSSTNIEDKTVIDDRDSQISITNSSNTIIENLVFIDKSLPDYKVIESSLNLPASTIIFLDPENYDGILKITEEIQKYNRLKSIHIVGHAKPAELILGSDNYWMDDLNIIQNELNSWKSHLSATADLVLYGCSLAETAQGKQTVDLLASLTGMDVIASTNLTGHASLNGDWELEYTTGTIESPIAFSPEIKKYKHTLQSLTFADLRNFDEVNEGAPGDGNWTYPDGTGRTAYQSVNTSNPVYLLSAESGYLNEVFKGTITVDAGAGDNDDIGFVFGFQSTTDTYIWSWDMGGIDYTNVRSGGSHLLYHKTALANGFTTLPGTLIAKGPNNDPWAHGITYQIEILYTTNRIKVKVNGVEKFDVTATDAGVAQFPPGKFGFYNYSQGGVTFGNIQNAPASDEPVPPSAQDDSYGMAPNTTLNVNPIDGILKNDYDANLDDFTIVKVSDVSNGSLSLNTNDGSFTYTPTNGYEGTDQFTYKLVQNTNATESAVRTVTIGVINNNQAPTDIQLSNNEISEGAADNTLIGLLTTTDGNNPDDLHDYSLSNNGGGRFTVNGNSLVVANSALLTPGNYTIVVRSTDLIGASYSETFTISVVSNNKPTGSNDQISMESGATYSFSSSDFTFNDTDGDTFGGIRIETSETAGDLKYNGSDVFDGTIINDISLLNFTSPSNTFGYPYASFTFKIIDSRGGISTSSYTMNIEVRDEVNPTAIAQNVIVQLDATGNGSTTAALVDNGSNDASGIASLSLNKTDFTCADIANNPNTVTLTVTDNNGNISTTTAEVNVNDEIDPTITTQNISKQLDENGLLSVTAQEFIATSSDNCSISSISIDRTDFDCANLGNYTVTITASDPSGNSIIETAILTVTGDDTDADLIANPCDTDDDNDGTLDTEDDFPLDENENTDTDGDGTGDNADTDDDGDGTPDAEDAFPLDENEDIDTDGDGTGDNADTDDDDDGTPDTEDDFPLDENENTDTDSDGTGDNADTDDDGDGTPDAEDAFPLDENEDIDTDGDGTGDNADTDDDDDGTPDTEDDFPLDENENTDTDGDGTGDNTDTDDDGDGTPDAEDAFPLDENEDTDTDGDGTGDNTDTDDDGDGTLDTEDDFPLDENENTDTDGDGTGNNADTDDDGDGTTDTEDAFPLDENEDIDTDGDGTGDNTDTDDDDDGTPDTEDEFPLDENENTDTDGDGTGDNTDTDDDGDGTLDVEDDFPLDENEDIDTDGDGTGDNADNDADNDGIPNNEDAFPIDPNEFLDSDGDGMGNNADMDDDNDGVEDIDTDGDGTGDNIDTDDDNDGVEDFEDDFPTDSSETVDTDGDGLGDNIDEDDDNDGYTDSVENEEGTNSTDSGSSPTDTDNDGIPDSLDDDDDNDGVTDANDDFPTEDEPRLRPAEAFTPNGDGVNDTWVIPGIDNYPNATVNVYNRWGHQVFAAFGYQNNWNGIYESNSNKLPAGSYLYIIDFGNGKAPIRGWLFLNY